MLFRQLFDQQSSTYTYLLADEASRDALLIDPVFEQARRDVALIEELGPKYLLTKGAHWPRVRDFQKVARPRTDDALQLEQLGPKYLLERRRAVRERRR